MLVDRKELGAETGDQRNIASLLADQIECANVIVLNKVDLLKEDEIVTLEAVLRKMNQTAEIVRSSWGKIDLTRVLNTRKFDFGELQKMPGWIQELRGNHVPETEEYNISSLVFRSLKPFHPHRLDKVLREGFDDLLRSKGLLWVAGSNAAMVWAQAGGAVDLQSGNWLHGNVDPSEWPAHLEQYKANRYGDKRVELVFIAQNLNKADLTKRLEDALVTEEEYQLGEEGWAQFIGES